MVNLLGVCNIPLDDYWNVTSQICRRTNAHGKQVRRRMFIKWYQLNSGWIISVNINTFKTEGMLVISPYVYMCHPPIFPSFPPPPFSHLAEALFPLFLSPSRSHPLLPQSPCLAKQKGKLTCKCNSLYLVWLETEIKL